MEHRWAVTEATGEFVYGGVEPYDCVSGLSPGQVRVVLDAPPNPRTQKWNGSAVVAKTAQEITDYDAAKADAEAVAQFDPHRLLNAVVWAVIDTYSAPATVAKYNAARTKVLTAYKTRPWLA